MTERFDWQLDSHWRDPQRSDFRFASFWNLLFDASAEEATQACLIGVVSGQVRIVRLCDLQQAALHVQRWCEENQLAESDRIVVLRLPGTSELLTAVTTLALIANRMSVVLPMFAQTMDLDELLAKTQAKELIAPVDRNASLNDSTRNWIKRCEVARGSLAVRLSEFPSLVEFDSIFEVQPSSTANDGHGTGEALVLSTSASTGKAKLVRYSETALLGTAEAWHAAGLLEESTTGGSSLCPLFSHSMGVRNVLHAVWNRRPTLLVPPEWLEEAPHRVVELLTQYPPQHFTAGPAILRAMASLVQAFPHAAQSLRCLKIVVSSGSEWNKTLSHLLSATQVFNAFGMTETQQVLSELLAQRLDQDSHAHRNVGSLGVPLPGVSVAVKFDSPSQQTGELLIRNRFGASGYLGEPDFPEWFASGDRVEVSNNSLRHICRIADDFLSLGSGLKCSVAELRKDYEFLCSDFPAVFFRSSSERAGVTALLFVGDRDPSDQQLQASLRSRIEAVHDRMRLSGNEDALRFQPLVAIGLIARTPLHQALGKIDWPRIQSENLELFKALEQESLSHPQLVEIPLPVLGAAAWYQHSAPLLGSLLQTLKLDVEYFEGEGDELTASYEGKSFRVLDVVGGYGAGLLGHNHPAIIDAAQSALRKIPLLDQFSRRRASSLLADRLSAWFSSRTGRRYVVLFSSTGAEAVEVSIKHLLLRWKKRIKQEIEQERFQFASSAPASVVAMWKEELERVDSFAPSILAIDHGYHGKTAGAAALTTDNLAKNPLQGLKGIQVRFIADDELSVPDSTLDTLQTSLVFTRRRAVQRSGSWNIETTEVSAIIGAIYEPIQGEGGIREIDASWPQAVVSRGLSLVSDEIQCGLGRSGEFPACPVDASIYLLGKSLGGGVAKIAATLIDAEEYCSEVERVATSTFSGDAFSATVALRVIDLIQSDAFASKCRELGQQLRAMLDRLQQDHPDCVANVSGRGAMQGLTLKVPPTCSRVLRESIHQGLGYFAASYLLHQHHVRILPTLSAPNTLRIEPSYRFSLSSMRQLETGLRDFLQRLQSDDIAGLCAHWVSHDSTRPTDRFAISDAKAAPIKRRRKVKYHEETPQTGARRVAFIFNSLDPAQDLLAEVPVLASWSDSSILELAFRLQKVQQYRPVPLFSNHLFQGKVWLLGIMLPATARELDQSVRTSHGDFLRERLQQAVELAAERGCEVVVLGAQTSVVTRAASTLVAPRGVQISTGNTFTVATMLTQIEQTRQRLGISRSSRLGIVGAAGNIGGAVARWYSQSQRWTGPMLLVGREGSSGRLERLRSELQANSSVASLQVSCNPFDLRGCDLVVSAVSGGHVVVEPQHLAKDRTILVADVSQPGSVNPRLREQRPTASLLRTGMVRLKQDDEFHLAPQLPSGTAFACAAEGILMGLEPHPQWRLTGSIDLEVVRAMSDLGVRYGMLDPLETRAESRDEA